MDRSLSMFGGIYASAQNTEFLAVVYCEVKMSHQMARKMKRLIAGSLSMICLMAWQGREAYAAGQNAETEIGDLQIVRLKTPEKNGENAAVFITHAGSITTGTLSLKLEDKDIVINDKGADPDVKAGDGIYSGFLKIDHARALSDVATYKKRLAKLKGKPRVIRFSGRSAIEEVGFSNQIPRETKMFKPMLAANNKFMALDKSVILPQMLAPTFDNSKVLAITDLSVVADQSRSFDPCNLTGLGSGAVNGAWSFKTLVANMANTAVTGISTQQFIHNWLLNWMSNQMVNSFTINARPAIKSFFPGWDGVNASTLNVDRLPFRLLAITNRMDLAKVQTYGPGSSGEIRFVFGLESGVGATSCTSPAAMPMTVIFEYRDNTGGRCTNLKSLANQWIALSSLQFPSGTYNTSLQAITDTVTKANAMPSMPNGSALGQLRTNEIAFSFPWQLREFVISSSNKSLVSDTVKQTPDESFMASATLGAYVNANLGGTSNILCDTAQIPLSFLNAPFRGAKADAPPSKIWTLPSTGVTPPTVWPTCYVSNSQTPLAITAQNALSEIRQHISLNTCDDCHTGETTTAFTHVNWSNTNTPAQLSGFMTGVTVADPAGSGIVRKYNDLARRAQILQDIAAKSCTSLVSPRESFFAEQQRMQFVH